MTKLTLTRASKDPVSDPLAQAIADFRSGAAKFCELPDFDDSRQHKEAIAATYGPPYDRLARWDQPALTRLAAIEALRLADEENRDCDRSGIAKAMTSAALRYFETERQAPTDCFEAIEQIHKAVDFLGGIYMAAEAIEQDHASAMKVISGAAIDCLNLALNELREPGRERPVAE